MKNLITTIFAICLFAFVVFGQTPNSSSFTVWEYKFEFNPKESKVNELGSQGWELVAIESGSQYKVAPTYVFKRAKK